MSVCVAALRSTYGCVPEFYPEILRSLQFAYGEWVLKMLEEGKVLLTELESLDLDDNNIRLPLRIVESYYEDVYEKFVEHSLWADIKKAPRPEGYLRDINRRWELAEAHFRGQHCKTT